FRSANIAAIAIGGGAIRVGGAELCQLRLRVAAVPRLPPTGIVLMQASTAPRSTLIVVGAPVRDFPSTELRHAFFGFRSLVANIAIPRCTIYVVAAVLAQRVIP